MCSGCWRARNHLKPRHDSLLKSSVEAPEAKDRASFTPSLGDHDGSTGEPGAEVSACCHLKGEISYTHFSTSLGVPWDDSYRLIHQ